MANLNVRAGPATWWRTRLAEWSAFRSAREEQVFLVLTLLIGALVGLLVVAFIVLTERVGARLDPAGGTPWRRLLVPAAGSLAMGYLLYRYFPDARGSGVPQTKAALYAREGKITLGTVFGKYFCTSATLASGIPLGREGPAVQVGGGIASVLGRTLGLPTERVKALIPVGAAAAVAAAFNTPLAAVLFALEEVVGDLHAPVLGSVVLASATSWGVLRLLLGNEPLFETPQYQLVHPWELVVYGLLGVAGGFVSVAFTQLLLRLRRWFQRLPRKTVWFQPLAGGLTVGIMGWFVPQVMGVGYKFVGDALNDHLAVKMMVLLLGLKLVATAVSYASGNAGGIFGPSLFLGAMLGGTIGGVAHHWFPAYMARIVRAPMTSVVMIFEITRDYAVIVPLMISNLVSYFISSRLQKAPIYEQLAEQDGIHLPRAESQQARMQRQVARVMRPASGVLDGGDSIEAVLETAGSALRVWLVGDPSGIIGVVTRGQLQGALSEGGAEKKVRDLISGIEFPHLHPDQSFDQALSRMGDAQLDVLPVVSRANVHELLGVVWLADVLKSYGVEERFGN